MLTISVRTLKHNLLLRTPDPSVAEALRFMQARPAVPDEAVETIDIDIQRCHGFLRVALSGYVPQEGTAQAILNELHGFHFDLTRSEFPQASLIHGGCLTFADGHTVVVGDKGAGKTTLLAYLGAQGWPVCGDEHVVVTGVAATPRPRSFRIKRGTLAYLPAPARALIEQSPYVIDWQGSPVYAIEPSAFGQEWVLRRRPIRNLVFLTDNHGGRSRVAHLGFNDAMTRLLSNTILPEQARARALAEIAAVARSARCWEMRNGQLKESADHLYNIVHRL